VRIERASVDRVDEAASLFRGMVEHHRQVVGGVWPVRPADDAWLVRREQYVEWLSGVDAWMLLAFDGDGSPPIGYAVLRLSPPGATWALGDRVGELESLAVAPGSQGRGVGTALVEACRNICREHGVTHWVVDVVDANSDAIRMYERQGFRPYYRLLMSEV